MSNDSAKRIEDIADLARKLSPAERALYLEYVCDTPDLRRAVEALLAAPEPPARNAGDEHTTRSIVAGDRFRVGRLLGTGAFGVVYEAFDTHRAMQVALKLLSARDTDRLLRFKHEFRSLVDVNHRNLVKLYDLFSEGEDWFFTMEFVRGANFLQHVRAGGTLNIDLTLSALDQIVDGLCALHACGMLHRDMKPQNVLVTAEQRVVILDFGLVRELSETSELTIAGTPPYMSPEQLRDGRLSEASDWYGVGVMIYEAITGRLPFRGGLNQIIEQKTLEMPPRPADLVTGIPPALDELCMRLLATSAHERPGADEIRQLLRAAAGLPAVPAETASRRPSPVSDVFVGREAERARLRAAYAHCRAGRTVAVNIYGRSGIGKTALIRQFLREVGGDPRPLVLNGRCHPNEAVQFKALDGIIDRLAKTLSRTSPFTLRSVLPHDFGVAKARFRAFSEIGGAMAPEPDPCITADPRELRRRAFSSIYQLIRTLSEQQPVIIAIDDLQWGDLDSVAFFRELLSHGDARILLLAGYRGEDAEVSSCLRAFGQVLAHARSKIECVSMELQELAPAEARRLAQEMLRFEATAVRRRAESIAAETRSPFLVAELVSFVRSASFPGGMLAAAGGGPDVTFDVDALIRRRVESIDARTRRLLQLVCVAGQPIAESVACAAFGEGCLGPGEVSLLSSERLIRSRERHGLRELETYHDRVRQVVLDLMSDAERRDVHLRLAETVQRLNPRDTGAVAVHLDQAGFGDRAGSPAFAAAVAAEDAFAFDQAAQLYRLAVNSGALEPEQEDSARRGMARALENAGRGSDAGRAWEDAAQHCSEASERVKLLAKAANCYLRAGHLERGAAILRSLARHTGIKLPGNRAEAALQLVWCRARLARRSLRIWQRPDPLPEAEATRLDAYWALTTGYSMVDVLIGSAAHARHLLAALEAGDPERLAPSVALDASRVVAMDARRVDVAERRLNDAAEWGLHLGQPYILGLAALGSALTAALTGRWKLSLTAARRAESILRERCAGTSGWEISTARIFLLTNNLWLGEWRQFRESYREYLRDAEERGDLYGSTELVILTNATAHLIDDEPETGIGALEDALRQWPEGQFDLPQFWAACAIGTAEIYQGRGTKAWQTFEPAWKMFRRPLSHLRRIQFVRTFGQFSRLICAVAAAAETADARSRAGLLRAAEDAAAAVEHEGVDWAKPRILLGRACIAAVRGQREQCIRLLTDAELGAEVREMRMDAAIARYRRGDITGGQAGAALRQSADKLMRAEGVVNPYGIVRMFAPGFPD